jgi:hypothetical protein
MVIGLRSGKVTPGEPFEAPIKKSVPTAPIATYFCLSREVTLTSSPITNWRTRAASLERLLGCVDSRLSVALFFLIFDMTLVVDEPDITFNVPKLCYKTIKFCASLW